MTQRKKWLLVFVIGGLFAVLTGCASIALAAPDSEFAMLNNSEISGTSTNKPVEGEDWENHPDETLTVNGEKLTEDIDMNVVLHIYRGWDDENNVKIPDAEYPLPDGDAEMIFELFYGHEKKVLDSPLCSVETIQLRIGEDFLGSSMDALNTLSGIVQGELVAIHLSEDECEALRKIISPYTQNIP